MFTTCWGHVISSQFEVALVSADFVRHFSTVTDSSPISCRGDELAKAARFYCIARSSSSGMSWKPEEDGQFKQQMNLKAPERHVGCIATFPCLFFVAWCRVAVSIVSFEPSFSDMTPARARTTCPSIPFVAITGQGAMERVGGWRQHVAGDVGRCSPLKPFHISITARIQCNSVQPWSSDC